MATHQSKSGTPAAQPLGGGSHIAEILNSVDATRLLRRLREYRLNGGRRTYQPAALWRAYMLSFILNTRSTNELINRLKESAELRLMCGFSSTLPHRTTFSRFISRLSQHRDLVDACLAPLTSQLRELLPGLGEKVAVDSTPVISHSNPRRGSDPEASWTAKKDPKSNSKDGLVWYWGYKLHLVVDAVHHVPLAGYTTTAKRHDSPELPPLLDRTQQAYPWLEMKYVMADRGYDARSNYADVEERGGAMICPMRKKPNTDDQLHGVFTKDGTPTCMGMALMQYVRTDSEKGHLYRCPQAGCHLQTRKGVVYCQDDLWVSPKEEDNPRLHGPVRRDSGEWRQLYRLRMSVERVFKSMKQSRRLNAHCARGLARVALHASMSVLAYSATLLVQTLAGAERPRWMVAKVA